MSANIVDVNSANWDAEVVQSALPVLVDVWAPWCGPCVSMLPALEAFAEEFAGQVKVVKVDSDQSPDIAARLGVRGVPYLVLLKSGKTVAVVAGRTRTRIAADVEAHLDRRPDVPRTGSDVARGGAWGGDPGRKQASIATARAALATGPAVFLAPNLRLAAPGRDDEASNVYCAAYGTADPAELEARAGLPASTLMLASAAIAACERRGAHGDGRPRILPQVGRVAEAPIAALEAIRVGTDPLAITRSYVVELLNRIEALRGHDDRGLASEQRALLRRLAELHRDDCTDPAAFRELRSAATAATDVATGDLETAALQFVGTLAWPLAGLTGELPEILGRVHGSLCTCLSPEQQSPEDKAMIEAVNAMFRALEDRASAEPEFDSKAEYARVRTAPEFVTVTQPGFQARQAQRDLVAAEAYAPFAVDVLLTAFRKV